MRTYSELITIPSYADRFAYLKLDGFVGVDTFGWDRYLNQQLYKSDIWKQVRNEVIVRDCGNDMAHPDFPINGKVIVHHMNPIVVDDILKHRDEILNPEFLVCVSFMTHQAIHYGDVRLLPKDPIERKPNDTCPWR
jgi:hypothetical protein